MMGVDDVFRHCRYSTFMEEQKILDDEGRVDLPSSIDV